MCVCEQGDSYCADAAFLGDQVQPRHLFANGVRLRRTTAPLSVVEFFGAGAVIDDLGYTVENAPPALMAWAAASAADVGVIEFVFGKAKVSAWSESRCAVLNVIALSPTVLRVNMRQPCFPILRYRPCGQGWTTPSAIENVPAGTFC